MLGECVISLVLSHHSKNLKQQMDKCYSLVTAQFYLASKGKYILKAWGQTDSKEAKWKVEQLNFGSSFYIFFLLPLSLPYVHWTSQEGCLFYLKFSLWSSDLPLFCFHRLSFLCPLATTTLDSFFLFYLPKRTVEKDANFFGMVFLEINFF